MSQETRGNPFCEVCSDTFSLLDASSYCPYCFSKDYSSQKQLCARCIKQPPLYNGVASAVLHEGVGANLVYRLKYCGQAGLVEGMASFMVLQWHKLGWPIPDVIVPAPIPRVRKWSRGYNQSFLLAQELGNMLGCPVADALKRRSGDLPQTAISGKERTRITNKSVSLRGGKLEREKVILMVDDVLTTGTTLRRCAEALFESYPSKLYAMTFSAAL